MLVMTHMNAHVDTENKLLPRMLHYSCDPELALICQEIQHVHAKAGEKNVTYSNQEYTQPGFLL